MKHSHRTARRAALAATTALTLLALPQTASAQMVMNGQFGVIIAHNEGTSINTKRLEGSFSGLVWGDLGLQMDLGIGKHENYLSTQPSATAHLYYQVSPEWTLGAFLTAEDRRPGNSYFYGLEAAYRTPAFGLEAYVAHRDDISATTTGMRYGFDMDYTLPGNPRWSLLAGGVLDDGAPLQQHYYYVGAGYEFREGLDFGLTVGETDQGDMIAAAMFTVTFGDGPAFGSRDTMGVFPGY